MAFAFALFTTGIFLFWIYAQSVECKQSQHRMLQAEENFNLIMHESAMREELVRIHLASSNGTANGGVLEAALYGGESSAQWAERIFVRFAGEDSQLTYDRERELWMASVPIMPGGPLASFEVPQVEELRPDLALMAALELLTDSAPAMSPEEEPEEVAVRYHSHHGCWQTFAPCQHCGGGWLNTSLSEERMFSLARLTAKKHLGGSDEEEIGGVEENNWYTEGDKYCTHCFALEMRASPPYFSQPVYWYDTVSGGWMLWHPRDGEEDWSCVSLGISSFFVGPGEVFSATQRHLGAY